MGGGGWGREACARKTARGGGGGTPLKTLAMGEKRNPGAGGTEADGKKTVGEGGLTFKKKKTPALQGGVQKKGASFFLPTRKGNVERAKK